MRRLKWIVPAATALAIAFGGAAAAAQIAPSGYVASGVSGGYPDSTGTELTDGVVADRHFTEYAPAGAPYLGWQRVAPDVTFAFDGAKTFGKVVIWFDDAGGRAGVTAPSGISVTLAGQTFSTFTIGAPLDAGVVYSNGWSQGGGTPYTLDLGGLSASSVALSIAPGGEWTFVSEVQFFDERAVNTGVPEPDAWALMILGFGAAGATLRRRRVAIA